jgi:hypothetical protein
VTIMVTVDFDCATMIKKCKHWLHCYNPGVPQDNSSRWTLLVWAFVGKVTTMDVPCNIPVRPGKNSYDYTMRRMVAATAHSVLAKIDGGGGMVVAAAFVVVVG